MTKAQFIEELKARLSFLPDEELGDQLARVLGQGEHQVLLLHVHMLIFNGNGLSTLKRAHGLLRKLVHVHTDPSLKAFDFL